MDTNELRKQLDEAFHANMAAFEGRKKGETLQFAAVDKAINTDTICTWWPKLYAAANSLLSMFGWLIPDNIENLIKSGLGALNTVIIPIFCPKA